MPGRPDPCLPQLGLALPVGRFGLGVLLMPLDLFALCDCPRGRRANLHQSVFHFLNDEADHLFRVFGAVKHGIEVEFTMSVIREKIPMKDSNCDLGTSALQVSCQT